MLKQIETVDYPNMGRTEIYSVPMDRYSRGFDEPNINLILNMIWRSIQRHNYAHTN